MKIGNCQGFWGDRPDAAKRLAEQAPDLDYLTLDYLAELSLSIMAVQKQKDPSAGYAKDFLEVVRSLLPFWEAGSKLKVVANAGGLNPAACGEACRKILAGKKKVAVVTGDDVLEHFSNRFTTANAYLGAAPIVEALRLGADIVVTGRVADPSLTTAPCIFHYGWGMEEYDKLAQATVAGHLLECGTQVTGGISTNWLKLPSPETMGYPIAEIEEDGVFVITKPEKSGGAVTLETVKEQLLYEIGDPARYLSPDVTLSFLSLKLEEAGKDRIRITGAEGDAPPETLKVSATLPDGYRAEAALALYGEEAEEKAERAAEMLLKRLELAGCAPEEFFSECFGKEKVMLRLAVKDPGKEKVERFSKEVAPLVTSGPQGITGYSSGRPKVRPVFAFSPEKIEKKKVKPKAELV